VTRKLSCHLLNQTRHGPAITVQGGCMFVVQSGRSGERQHRRLTYSSIAVEILGSYLLSSAKSNPAWLHNYRARQFSIVLDTFHPETVNNVTLIHRSQSLFTPRLQVQSLFAPRSSASPVSARLHWQIWPTSAASMKPAPESRRIE
jgi:hypothetical protein